MKSGDAGVTKVVVIGGGLAGMSTAEALARQQRHRVDVTVLEAKRVTGGRAGSFTDAVCDEQVDYCQHVAMGCCTNLVDLLRRCRLDDLLCRHETLTFLHENSPPSRFAPSKRLPAPLHLWRVIGSLAFLDRRQKWQVVRGMTSLLRASNEQLTGKTAGAWLRQQRQDDDTIEEFWGTFIVSALGEKIDLVDMSAVRKVMVDGFASARGASDVLVPRIPLADFFGKRLPERISEMGVRFCTGHVVDRVEHVGDRARVQTNTGACFEADHVVSTVPWHVVGKLLPDISDLTLGKAFHEIPSSAITGVHLWLDRQITDQPLVVLVGTVAQWLFRPPWLDDAVSHRGHYYQVVISASDHWKSVSKELLIEKVMADLQQLSGQAKQAKLLHSRIVTDPHSVFSIQPRTVELRPTSATPLPWLHLAGDWIDTGWPATMEGAVISGRMAANSIANQKGWEACEIDPGLPRGMLSRILMGSR